MRGKSIFSRLETAVSITAAGLILLVTGPWPTDGATAQGDIAPPGMADLRFEPAHIYTANGPQTITVTAIFTDDLSGFHDAFIVLHLKSEQLNQTPPTSGIFGMMKLRKGCFQGYTPTQ